jgi:Xaa-Pro aminopeptidase
MTPETYISRSIVSQHVTRLAAAMSRADVDGFLLFQPSNLLGFCGMPLGPSDRLVCALINRRGETAVILPSFEKTAANGVRKVFPWDEHEDPYGAIASAAASLGIDAGRILLDRHTWIAVRDRLESCLQRATFETDSDTLNRIRVIKTSDEIDAIRQACACCSIVFDYVPSVIAAGMTEDQLYRGISNRLLAENANTEIVLVQSGPNAAVPHALTGTRRFEPGDAVIVDCVCKRNGYCGDMTRTYLLGDPMDVTRDAHVAVRQAHDAAIEMIRPGVTANDVDAVARSIIERAGFGNAFLHRLGHGIGLEGHEAPFIVQGSTEVLEAGMCFTVEPGIYLKDAFGIRLESVVTVTSDGCEILSDMTPLDTPADPSRIVAHPI